MAVVWMRLGQRNVHAAHAYANGKQLCKTPHGQRLVTTENQPPPHEVDLTPHGVPYGRTCQRCLRLSREAS